MQLSETGRKPDEAKNIKLLKNIKSLKGRLGAVVGRTASPQIHVLRPDTLPLPIPQRAAAFGDRAFEEVIRQK